MESSRDSDRAECISEGHLQFMREYIRHEEAIRQVTLDRFLREKVVVEPKPIRKAVAAA
jgi:hypothetical protein